MRPARLSVIGAVVGLLLVVTGLTACGSAVSHHSHARVGTSATHTPSDSERTETAKATTRTPIRGNGLVTGRASHPEDETAPGIQIAPGQSFGPTRGNRRVVISGTDWNTIVGTSQVRMLITTHLVPPLAEAATGTTRNRLQYLADRLLAIAPRSFNPLSVATGFNGRRYATIVALMNRTSRRCSLTSLRLTVRAAPSRRLIARRTFRLPGASAIVLSRESITFARLVLRLPHAWHPTETTTHFHYRYRPSAGC